MTIFELIAIFAIPGSLVIIICSILFFMRQRLADGAVTRVVSYAVSLIIFALGIGVFGIGVKAIKFCETNNEDRYEDIQNKIDSGYTVYINGVEVDVKHINLESYSCDTISAYDDIREIQIAANR